jgi:uncharacterized DUF497 family protein
MIRTRLYKDVLHREEEDRLIILGSIGPGAVIVAVHTWSEEAGEEVMQMISARAASSHEREIYETAHKKTAARSRRYRRKDRRRY